MARKRAGTKSQAKKSGRFFLHYALATLLIVIAGFACKAVALPEQLPPITPTIIAHIIIMLAWYSLVVVQAGLISQNNKALHMRLGRLSGLIAAAVIIAGTLVTLETYARRFSENAIGAEFAVYLSFSSLLGFAVLYGLALHMRTSANDHKRYILMAGTAMMLAATFRLAAAFGAPQPIPMGIVIQYAFITALMFYDLKQYDRLHTATMISMLVCIIMTAGIFTLGASSLWAEFIRGALAP